MKYDFDIIVIGAGSGGLTAAIGGAKLGKKVCLIEKGAMGGDCTNTGCIPSKTLIHHARNVYYAEKVAGKRQELSKYKAEILPKVRAKVQEIRDEESPELIQEHFGVVVKKGVASFADKNTVLISNEQRKTKVSGKYIVIASGSHPRRIAIPGLAEKDLLTNENIFELSEIPKKLLVIGAGAIGCEMAQAFAFLGSQVTVVVRAARILEREEPEASTLIQESFADLGIKVITHSEVVTCENQKATVKNVTNDNQEIVEYDKVLMAVGRAVSCQKLGLDKADIDYDDHGIKVDDHYRTTTKNVFAVGDVATQHKFTHVADDMARHILKKIIFPLAKPVIKPIPRVTYLEQEVASVGMLMNKALNHYSHQELLKIVVDFAELDRAKTDDLSKGVAVVVVKRLSGKILGASIIGKNAGEMISLFTLAIQEKISLYRLNKMIVPYPVLGQLYKKLSDKFLSATFANLKPDLMNFGRKHLPQLIALIFWVLIGYSFWRYKTVNNLSSLDIMKELYHYLTGTMYGPFLYILVYAVRPLILFPATLLTLLSGALFGLWGGIFYTVIGENMSANLAFFVGRLFGKDLIPKESQGFLARWKNKLAANSFISVMIMRLIYLPFDMVNYGCGLLNVQWRAYFLATLIGIMPGLITFVSFGASIENIAEFDPGSIKINPLQLGISIALFILSLWVARLVKKKTGINV